MPTESQKLEEQPIELAPDFFGESRHEFVERLAYQHWEARGMPLGTPEIDWFAAERALYESLIASGSVLPSAGDRKHMERVLYS